MLLPTFLPLISFHISHHQHFPTHPSPFPLSTPSTTLLPLPLPPSSSPPNIPPTPNNPLPSKLTIPPDGQLRRLRLGRPRLPATSMVRAAKIRAVKTPRADQKLWDSKVRRKNSLLSVEFSNSQDEDSRVCKKRTLFTRDTH